MPTHVYLLALTEVARLLAEKLIKGPPKRTRGVKWRFLIPRRESRQALSWFSQTAVLCCVCCVMQLYDVGLMYSSFGRFVVSLLIKQVDC